MKELRAGSHREIIPGKMLQFLESILQQITGGRRETRHPHVEADTHPGGDGGGSIWLSDSDSSREDCQH